MTTKKEKPHQIYLLIDPDNGTVRYVGKSKNPRGRLRQHIKESMQRQNTAKKKWIHGLITTGKAPKIAVTHQIWDETLARLKESETCHQYRDTIYNLHDPRKGAKDFHNQKKRKTDDRGRRTDNL